MADQGIPDGVPALDFSTTGFDQLAAQVPAAPPPPEEGIELTASSLGDSRPTTPKPAPPELAEPEVPMAVSAISQSFAFGGDEPESAPPALPAEPAAGTEAFSGGELPHIEEDNSFATMRMPALETPAAAPAPVVFTSEPPEVPPAAFASAEPFVAAEPHVESVHDLFEPEPAPVAPSAPAPEPEPVAAAPSFDEEPVRGFAIAPEPPHAAPEAAVLAPLAAGAVSAEAVEHIAQRVKAIIPEALSAPPAPAAVTLTDDHLERIAQRAAELVPRPAAVAAEPADLTEAQIEKVARKVVELAMPQIERIAWEVIPDMAEMIVRKRIAELEKAAEEES